MAERFHHGEQEKRIPGFAKQEHWRKKEFEKGEESFYDSTTQKPEQNFHEENSYTAPDR